MSLHCSDMGLKHELSRGRARSPQVHTNMEIQNGDCCSGASTSAANSLVSGLGPGRHLLAHPCCSTSDDVPCFVGRCPHSPVQGGTLQYGHRTKGLHQYQPFQVTSSVFSTVTQKALGFKFNLPKSPLQPFSKNSVDWGDMGHCPRWCICQTVS